MRFGKSSTVGAYFGLTPKKYQSGETDRDGEVIKPEFLFQLLMGLFANPSGFDRGS
jgi:hypothetical protein